MQTTFYLKYRPQTFSDLDSADAKEELIKIFSSGRIPHAFLFSGPKGIGKTSAARIVAKAVNCESRVKEQESGRVKGFEPCNKCPNCLSITSGTNVDIIEIDAASNRGIDDIKELREKIKLSPATLKYKVYIIDEVHMLTTEAFNALLKTLEEPPEHAIFILCTTDTEKLPKTIISRCQQINFKRANPEEIVSRLKKICQEESLESEQEALREIAKLSDGSFRDATKILEQISFAGKISLAEVRKTAGILAEFDPKDFLTLLKDRKVKEALEWINSAANAGANLKVLTENISEKLRQALLKNFGVIEEEETLDLSFKDARELIALFSRAYVELKTAVIPQLPIEMVIVEWGTGNKKSEDRDEGVEKEEEIVREEKKVESTEKDQASHFSSQISASLEEVITRWSEILEKVKPLNHSVQAFLRACRPIAFENGFLTLEVFYKFHKEQLETDKCRKIFEQVASEVISCPIKLKCTLGEKPQKKIEKETVEPSFTSGQESVKAGSQAISSPPSLADSDIMKIAEEIFNGATIN